MSISNSVQVSDDSKSGNSTAKVQDLLPGIVLVTVVSGAAYSLRGLPGFAIFSPLILAVIIGMIFSNIIEMPRSVSTGIAFCQRPVLRAAIVLLGFQVTFTQIQAVGSRGLMIVAASLLATYVATLGLAKLLGVERKLAELIAAGTSVCGASAIIAANSVTNADDGDVTYSVAAITLFGTIAMFAFPLLGSALGLSSADYGLWVGTAIHEVAQVIGAGFQHGSEAGEVSTIAKLSRVALLAPLVLSLGYLATMRQSAHAAVRAPVPWFVLGFIAIVAVNSMVPIPGAVSSTLGLLTTFLLTLGLAAMGLRTNVAEIRARGAKPMLLAMAASIFIAAGSLVLIKIV